MNSPDRAQSEVIGVVLLLGLTITAVGITVGIGSTALGDVQSSADVQRIEGVMTQVDSKTSLVAHGGSTSQRVRLDPGQRADVRVDGEAGVMRIEVEAENEAGGVETVTENVTLGTVVYERGDERVAYQGGGVWRSNGDGSWMVSPPEFHYRGDTLTLPLVTIDGVDGRLGDAAVVTGTSKHPEGLFPSENVSNPLLGGNVTITVESEYAEAWGRFFESRTSANVTQLSRTEVRVALRTETVHPTLSTGASAVGTSKLEFGGVKTLYADSYDSTDGPYPGRDNSSNNSVIKTANDFHLTSGGGGNTESIEIRGDLVARSFNFPPGQAAQKLTVTGENRTDDSFDEPVPVSGAIAERMTRIRDENLDESENVVGGIEFDDGNNHVIGEDTYVSGNINISDGSRLTVENGATLHVADELDVKDGGMLVLGTSGGDVDVLVEDGTDVSGTSKIRAVGGGRANLYVDGPIDVATDEDDKTASITTAYDTRLEVYNTGKITLDDGANVTADDDLAENLWLYSSAHTIDIGDDGDDQINFTGVLYAPESNIEMEGKITFKGSFTANRLGLGIDISDEDDHDDNTAPVALNLHYDESLATLQPFEGDSVPVVSHLHVSRHRVTIEDD